MDTAITEATISSVELETNSWRPQKRISECYTDFDDDDITSAKDVECNHTKRFRSNAPAADKQGDKFSLGDLSSESPIVMSVMMAKQPKKMQQISLAKNGHHGISENVESTVLSPITEISLNMSETSLTSDKDGAVGVAVDGDQRNFVDDDGTPLRRYSKSNNIRTHKFNQFTRMLQRNNKNDTSVTATITTSNDHGPEENQQQSDKLDDEASNSSDSGFQMPRNATALRVGGRRLNMDTSAMQEGMLVDELSFYEDEETRQRSLAGSPEFLGLLSPEGSPQRFQIIERATVVAQPKILQPAPGRQQKAAPRSTLSSNTTSAKTFRMFHSLSSGSTESTSMDDEYMELFEMESLESQSQTHLNFPSDLNSLISGHIKHATSPARNSSGRNSSLLKTPEMRRPNVRRCLSMTENQQQTPKTPELVTLKQTHEVTSPFAASTNYCFKRPDPPGSAGSSPILVKRYRIDADKENLNGSIQVETSPASAAYNSTVTTACTRPPLRKSMSMNDAEILSALARSDRTDQPDLIGDFSKPFVLPLIEGRHRDLKSVTSDTVARLINGEFDDQVASYKIIDCRYPYEFDGGHIRGAKNLYTQEQIIEEFLTAQKTEQQAASSNAAGHKRNIIIFHCEFSSERGPKLSRFLRNHDRARNTSLYPALDYPEIYLLHNGYKDFYETHAELCDPLAYRPMLEPSFSEAYRHFRAKSKSWNCEGFGGASTRMKKSRTRLLL